MARDYVVLFLGVEGNLSSGEGVENKKKGGRRKRLFLRHDGGFEEADVLDPGLDDVAWF